MTDALEAHTERLIIPGLPTDILVIERRAENLVTARVPLPRIAKDDVPVDQGHVNEIQHSIRLEEKLREGNGQLTPLLLAHLDLEDQLPLLDGYHRREALRRMQAPYALASILLGSSWDTIWDHRILATKTQTTVSFARLADWIARSWELNPLSKKLGPSAVFSILYKGSLPDDNGITEVEIAEATAWATMKCEAWQLSPNFIYSHMDIASIAAPELIKMVRSRGAGGLPKGTIENIARCLPKNYPIQMEAVALVQRHGLNSKQARELVFAIQPRDSQAVARAKMQGYLHQLAAAKPSPAKVSAPTHPARPEVTRAAAPSLQQPVVSVVRDMRDGFELAALSLIDSSSRPGYKPGEVGSRHYAVADPVLPTSEHASIVESVTRTASGQEGLAQVREHYRAQLLARIKSTFPQRSPAAQEALLDRAIAGVAEDISADTLQYGRLHHGLIGGYIVACAKRIVAESVSSGRPVKEAPPIEGLDFETLQEFLERITDRHAYRAIVLGSCFRLSIDAVSQISQRDHLSVRGLFASLAKLVRTRQIRAADTKG